MNQDSARSESEHANHSDIRVENEAETIDEKKEKHSVSPEQAENEMKKGELDECEEEIVATIGMRQEYFPDWLEIVQPEQDKTGVAIEDILERLPQSNWRLTKESQRMKFLLKRRRSRLRNVRL